MTKTKKILLVFLTVIAAAFSLAACSAPKYGEELLANGGFESVMGTGENAAIDNWITGRGDSNIKIKSGTTTTVDGHDKVVKMDGTTADYNYLYQEVKIKKNAYYALSVRIYTAASSSELVTGTGAFIGILEDDTFIFENVLTNENGGWLEKTIYFYNKDYSSIRVALRVGTSAQPSSITSSAKLEFDDASLKTVKKEEIPSVVLNSSTLLHRLVKTSPDYSTGFSIFLTVFLGVAAFAASAVLYAFIRKGLKDKDTGAPLGFKRLKPTHLLLIILGSAFVIRFLIMQTAGGYDEGTAPHYFSGLFRLLTAEYQDWASVLRTSSGSTQTPGMLLVYALFGWISNLFNVEYGSAAVDLVAKIPGVIADLLAAGYIFIFARRFVGEKTAFIYGLIYALLPPVFIASAGWGADDSLMGLFLILAFFALLDKKHAAVCVYATLAVVFNVKALYVLPLIVVYLGYIFYRDPETRVKLAVSAALCVLAFWAVSFPFTSFADNPFYVFVHYTALIQVTTSATSAVVPVTTYATLDAFNFYALIKGNFAEFTGFQGALDLVVALAVFAGAIVLYLKRKNRADLILLSAFTVTALFMFTLGMRPYSMVFALAPMLIYVLVANEKRVFLIFSAFSLTTVLNIMLSLSSDGLIGETLGPKNYTVAVASLINTPLMIIMTVLNLLLTVYFAYVVYDITYKGRLKDILPQGDDSGDGYILTKTKGVLGRFLARK
ncbi:MAG: hypothetical protein LBP79_07550 [Clostridiales bacterium]|jgi:Gpi18-like mannosyltransferase|nr:hypothetical protein [Clostridiales bacterium]